MFQYSQKKKKKTCTSSSSSSRGRAASLLSYQKHLVVHDHPTHHSSSSWIYLPFFLSVSHTQLQEEGGRILFSFPRAGCGQLTTQLPRQTTDMTKLTRRKLTFYWRNFGTRKKPTKEKEKEKWGSILSMHMVQISPAANEALHPTDLPQSSSAGSSDSLHVYCTHSIAHTSSLLIVVEKKNPRDASSCSPATAILEIKQGRKEGSKQASARGRASERATTTTTTTATTTATTATATTATQRRTKANKRQTGSCSPSSHPLGTQSRRLERSCSQCM